MYAKKGSGEASVTYAEAVEEAICFGWIDTTVRTIDDAHYMQRFTPRTNARNWSAINLKRFEKMVAAKKMTKAGLAVRPPDVKPPKARLSSGATVPGFVAAELARHPKAQALFDSLPPSYRRDYLRWITEAKQEATRLRRLEEAIRRLESGQRRVFVLK